MEFGIFSNNQRPGRIIADSYEEDLHEIVTADRVGIREAWISEHSFPAELVICKATPLTSRILMGPGVRPLPMHNPIQMVIEANACDHLTRGRYLFGFGLGGPATGALRMKQRGLPDVSHRRAMMWESIDLIVRCWTEPEPFDFHGDYYHGEQIKVIPPPYTKPHPPIGVASFETRETMDIAGQRGFLPMFSQYDAPARVREMGDAFVESGGKRSAMRVTKFVYVSTSTEQGKAELRPSIGKTIEIDKQLFPHHFQYHVPEGGTMDDIDFDFLVDHGHYVVGDADQVCERLVDFYRECHGFGTLMLLMGKDFGSREQRARSMELFMEQVAPRLRDLNPD